MEIKNIEIDGVLYDIIPSCDSNLNSESNLPVQNKTLTGIIGDPGKLETGKTIIDELEKDNLVSVESNLSNESGGTNIIKFITSSGKTYSIKILNGKDGSKGETGKTGENGKSVSHYFSTDSDGFPILTLTSASGTSSVQLKGTQGQRGEKGDTGEAGPQGPKGEKGAKGETGEKGDRGDKGDTGAQGPRGVKGDKGEKGNTGSKGDKGDKGDTGAKGDSFKYSDFTPAQLETLAENVYIKALTKLNELSDKISALESREINLEKSSSSSVEIDETTGNSSFSMKSGTIRLSSKNSGISILPNSINITSPLIKINGSDLESRLTLIENKLNNVSTVTTTTTTKELIQSYIEIKLYDSPGCINSITGPIKFKDENGEVHEAANGDIMLLDGGTYSITNNFLLVTGATSFSITKNEVGTKTEPFSVVFYQIETVSVTFKLYTNSSKTISSGVVCKITSSIGSKYNVANGETISLSPGTYNSSNYLFSEGTNKFTITESGQIITLYYNSESTTTTTTGSDSTTTTTTTSTTSAPVITDLKSNELYYYVIEGYYN